MEWSYIQVSFFFFTFFFVDNYAIVFCFTGIILAHASFKMGEHLEAAAHYGACLDIITKYRLGTEYAFSF